MDLSLQSETGLQLRTALNEYIDYNEIGNKIKPIICQKS